MTNVIVAGSKGYIGQFTCKLLVRENIAPWGIDYKNNTPSSIENIHCDPATNPLNIRPKAVIDLSGYIDARLSVGEALKYYQNNIENKIRFLSSLKHSSVKYYIFASSIAAQYPNLNPYARTKNIFENILSDCWNGDGRKYAVLRYSNVSGASEDMGENHDPETHLIPRLCLSALGKILPIEIYGNCTRDYVHVEDVAQANVTALKTLMEDDRGSFKCDIGGGNEFKTSEIIVKCQTLGINPKYTLSPPNKKEPESLPINLQAAKERMGWEPTRDIKSIIESSYKWYQNAH